MQIENGKLVSDQDDESNLVEWLGDVMAVKLRTNRGKLHWLSAMMPVDELLAKLDDEVNELRNAVVNDTDSVWEEAADVANFAAMIADRVSQAPDGV
jgi:hypothetical protein